MKQAGDEKGIEKYIKTLSDQVDAMKATSGLTDDEIHQYETLAAHDKEINKQISNLSEDKKTIRNLQGTLNSQIDIMRSTLHDSDAYLNDPDIKAHFKSEMKVIESFSAALRTATDNIGSSITSKAKKLDQDLAMIKASLAPLLSKVQLQAELKQKTAAINAEQQKLDEIAIKKNALKTKRGSYQKKIETITEAYKQVIAKYENLRNEFKTFESKFGEITLSVLVSFNDEAFNETVVREYLNKNDLKRVIPEAEWGEEFIYRHDPTKHLNNIAVVFDGLINGTINTVKGRHVKDAVSKLLDNYFYLDFRIFFKNDALDKMSPGKRGLVLLQLLINLSNQEWPILLDQPEDDLDNRSVYDDLVSFLKNKKIQRQIIIVTHNPNLVVGADSEETIVANQSGQEVGRENRKHRFEYVSSAIENSFERESAQEPAILYRKGIRQHVCEILEGGREAFQKREQKYSFPED